MIKLGFARTTEGGFYGVDRNDNDKLLCCGISVYDNVSGEEKVVKVIDAEDICEILHIGDYVNGFRIDDINVQGRIIYCNDYKIEYTPEQVIDVMTEERFNSNKFILARAYERVKELEEGNV